jgi:hypothetical protein
MANKSKQSSDGKDEDHHDQEDCRGFGHHIQRDIVILRGWGYRTGS